MTPPLPRAARWILERVAPKAWRDSIEGDLTEERTRRQRAGRRAGALWASAAALRTSLRLAINDGRAAGPSSTTTIMDGVADDVRYSVRRLFADRSYTAVVSITLAVGLGAGAAVFTLANWLLLRPLPGVRDQDRLVTVGFGSSRARGPISLPDFTALRAGVPALEDAAGYQTFPLHVGHAGAARRLDAEIVSDRYFDVLRGAIARGRGFSLDEALSPAAPATVVISHRLWRSDFGEDPSAIGRTIAVNGQPFTVIGITARGFHGATLSGGTDLWTPVGQHRLALPMYPATILTNRRFTIFFGVVGRLREGATAALAADQAEAVRARLAAANPADRRLANFRFDVTPGVESRPWIRERLGRAMALLSGGVVLLLALTCANVGNLMITRALARRHEIATRLALGASRVRMARLLLVETMVLAAAAGVAALGLASATATALEGTVVLQGLPPLDRAEIDAGVSAFVLLTSMIVGVAATVLPALATRGIAPGAALREGGRTQSASGRRVRAALSTAQVAMAVVLLLGATLLTRSMAGRLSIETGFDPARVLAFSLEPGLQMPAEQQPAFYRRVVNLVREQPGVREAGLVWLRPFSQGAADTTFRLEGQSAEAGVSAELNNVSPGFFAAMGVPIVDGRDFTDAEFLRPDDDGGGVVIVSESLSRRLSQGGSPVGRRIVMDYPEGRLRTIVGVVRDTRLRRTVSVSLDAMFEPFGQTFTSGWATVVVGLAAPAEAVAPVVRDAVATIDPDLPVYDVARLDEAIGEQFADELLLLRLMAAFAAIATMVASVGLYSVLSRGVVERRRELGIRVALGATPRSLARLVTIEGLRVLLVGTTVGLAASWALRQSVEAHLYGVHPLDAISIVSAIGLITVVVLLSSALPARRASAFDPAETLR